jgi:hypothetical protein
MPSSEFKIDIIKYSKENALDNWATTGRLNGHFNLRGRLGLVSSESPLLEVCLAEKVAQVCQYEANNPSVVSDVEQAMKDCQARVAHFRGLIDSWMKDCFSDGAHQKRARMIELSANTLIAQATQPDILGSNGKSRHLTITLDKVEPWSAYWLAQLSALS